MMEEKSYVQNNLENRNERITYSQFGFRSAGESKAHPETLKGYLDTVYNDFLKRQKLDEQEIQKKIHKLDEEILFEKNKKNETIAELDISKQSKEDKENEISELEIEKLNIIGNPESVNTVPFVIASFITLLLTLYLFVFYSSSGYSAFFGIGDSLGFIRSDVFSEAINQGGGVIALILLFPIIFLGLGFLIHDSLEKKKYGIISALLFITFIADAFIGYKIAEGIHTRDFFAGNVDTIWNPKMVFTDINFYLILILGFAVYVIWGFLLNYVLSHPYLKPVSERIKLLRDNIDRRITRRKEELLDIKAKIAKLESDITTCNDNIEEKTKSRTAYKTGTIPVNVPELEAFVGEFMGGWNNYTKGCYTGNSADKLIEDANKLKEEWVNQKKQSFKNG